MTNQTPKPRRTFTLGVLLILALTFSASGCGKIARGLGKGASKGLGAGAGKVGARILATATRSSVRKSNSSTGQTRVQHTGTLSHLSPQVPGIWECEVRMKNGNTTVFIDGKVNMRSNGTYEDNSVMRVKVGNQLFKISGCDKGVWSMNHDLVTAVIQEEDYAPADAESKTFFESAEAFRDLFDGVPSQDPEYLKFVSRNGNRSMFPLDDDRKVMTAWEYVRTGESPR